MPTSDALSRDRVQPANAAATSEGAREFLQLSKPGITRLVTIASGVGFVVATAWHGTLSAGALLPGLACLVGTAVASAGANAFNQVIEVQRDALMSRTARRPLPAGRLDPNAAWLFALACSLAGPLLLGLTTNWVAAIIAALTIVLYVTVYTPLKPISSASTYVGAIPGALPCLIGWTAASPTPIRDLTMVPAWSVFAILLVWQIPHFLAIAMMYREQYERAGFRPVPRWASSARIASWVMAWAALTVGASVLPLVAMPTLVGAIYAAVAAVAGASFVYLAVLLMQRPTAASARRVFFGSIMYLPVVYLALVLDSLINQI